MKTASLLLIAILLLASCSIDVDYHMPAARFSTPETTGGTLVDLKIKGDAGLSVGSSHKITLGEVYSFLVFNISPNVSTGASIEKSFSMGANASLSLFERLDFYYRAQYDSPDIVGLKFQFIGDSQLEASKGLKMAITGGYGTSEKDEGTLKLDGNGNPERTYNADIEIDVWDIGLITGYRINNTGLIYLSKFYTYYDTDGRLTSNTFATENVRGASRSYGALLGVRLTTENKRAHFNVELGATHARWEQHLDTTSFTSGASISVSF